MNPFETLSIYRRLQRSQWRDRESLRRRQERKLVRIVEHAVRTVPFYRERFRAAGVTPEDVRRLEDLEKIPITRKADLQAADPDSIVSSAFARETLIAEHTSGSTGRPFTIRLDPRFVAVRNGLFLRALGTAGYRPGAKLMLVSGDGRRRARLRRWLYASLRDDPERLLEELNRFRPHVLYGCVTPLRELARLLRESGRAIHRPAALVTTAEALDASSRRSLRDAFGSDPFDVYGLTEMGLVAWECNRHAGYHFAEDTAIVEFPPTGGAGAERRLVMTNLELLGSPMLRLETGDLGVPGPVDRCGCGRELRRLERIDGRLVDCVRLRDGRTVSPYRFTLALERIPGVDRYQVVQRELDVFTVRLESRGGDGDPRAEDAVRRAVADLVGGTARVDVSREPSLDVPGRKFRVVECRLVPDPA